MDEKEISKLVSNDEIKLYFPPVLDKDAVFAARFLTKEDAKASYSFINLIFNAIEEGNLSTYVLAEKFLNKNEKAYKWLVTFFKELEKVLGVEDTRLIPDYSCDVEEPLDFPPPCKVIERRKKDFKYRLEPIKIKLNKDDVINKHRVMYIRGCHEVEDFYDGYPSWYILSDTTIFENYNIKTNRRVRIDCRKGEFLYFIAGASDNWQQIVDVPLEIDYVIAALLFRN